MPVPLLLLIVLVLQFGSSASFSLKSPASPPPKYQFRSFEFDPLTGICRRPASFQCHERDKETQFFVMKNVAGDGDCVFQAVLSSVFISMGMMNPDAAFSSTMSSMALEMRKFVAQFLSSPEGTLYVNPQQTRKRIVRCKDLLQSAATNEGLTAKEYLSKLCKSGKKGGLYGGGPELTVLSNIVRRPISIYHLKPQSSSDGATVDTFCEIERMGVFGEGLFEDTCTSIPDSVISNAIFFTMGRGTQGPGLSQVLGSPLKCSWHLHILIADASATEKHATVLLPSVPILHNDQ